MKAHILNIACTAPCLRARHHAGACCLFSLNYRIKRVELDERRGKISRHIPRYRKAAIIIKRTGCSWSTSVVLMYVNSDRVKMAGEQKAP